MHSPYSRTVREALSLVLLTGCRSGEVVAALWRDTDLDWGVWAIRETKNSEPHDVMLPRQAVELLKSRQGIDQVYVFPSPRVVQDRILDHVDSSVSAIYDVHRYSAEARDWLQKWADYLEVLTAHNVVPLRAAWWWETYRNALSCRSVATYQHKTPLVTLAAINE